MDKATEEHYRKIGPFELMRSIARGEIGSSPQSLRWQEAEAWAKAEILVLESAASVARDKREEETLLISRNASETAAQALLNSRRANNIAIIAAIFTVATAIKSCA